jgi:hypothetical protein
MAQANVSINTAQLFFSMPTSIGIKMNWSNGVKLKL